MVVNPEIVEASRGASSSTARAACRCRCSSTSGTTCRWSATRPCRLRSFDVEGNEVVRDVEGHAARVDPARARPPRRHADPRSHDARGPRRGPASPAPRHHVSDRLGFAATSAYGAECLRRVVAAGAPIEIVLTQPDRPAGRSRRPTPPPAADAARELGLPVLQPERAARRRRRPASGRRGGDGHLRLRAAAAGRAAGRVSVGQPAPVGAAALARGGPGRARDPGRRHRRPAAAVMAVVAELDAGPVATMVPFEIGPRDNAGDVMERSLELGAPPLARRARRGRGGLARDDAAGGGGRHLRAQADGRRPPARPAGSVRRRRPSRPRAGAAHRRRAPARRRALHRLATPPRPLAALARGGGGGAPTGACWSGSPTAPSRSTSMQPPASGRWPPTSCCAAGAARSARPRGPADVRPARGAERARPGGGGRRLGRPCAGRRDDALQARRPRSRVRVAARARHGAAAPHARPRADGARRPRAGRARAARARHAAAGRVPAALHRRRARPRGRRDLGRPRARGPAARRGRSRERHPAPRRAERGGPGRRPARRDRRRRRPAPVVPRLDRRAVVRRLRRRGGTRADGHRQRAGRGRAARRVPARASASRPSCRRSACRSTATRPCRRRSCSTARSTSPPRRRSRRATPSP